MLDMHEVIGSIPIVSTKRKTDVIDVRFSFGGDLFDRSNSRKARIWFAFPPKSASSSRVSLKAWNIAVLSGTLRMANANCLSFGDDHSIEATRAKREFGSHSRRRATVAC